MVAVTPTTGAVLGSYATFLLTPVDGDLSAVRVARASLLRQEEGSNSERRNERASPLLASEEEEGRAERLSVV